MKTTPDFHRAGCTPASLKTKTKAKRHRLGQFCCLLWVCCICSTGFSCRKVYICDSKHALRYHYSPRCRGLSNCTYRVISISQSEAEKQGRTLCRWEISP